MRKLLRDIHAADPVISLGVTILTVIFWAADLTAAQSLHGSLYPLYLAAVTLVVFGACMLVIEVIRGVTGGHNAAAATTQQTPTQRETLIASWRSMISEIIARSAPGADVSALIQQHPHFLTLQQYLSAEVRSQVYHTRTFVAGSKIPAALELLRSDIDRIEQQWGLTPTVTPNMFATPHRAGIELYQGRSDTRPSLVELMDRASTIWIATHEATNLRGQQLLRKPIERLILLDPEGLAVDLLASVSHDRTPEQIRDNVRLSIQDAKNNVVAVKTFDGPITAMILGDPTSGHGWAQVELYFPWSSAHYRPSILVQQTDYPIYFARLLQIFGDMWDRPPKPLDGQQERARQLEDQLTRINELCDALTAQLQTAEQRGDTAHQKRCAPHRRATVCQRENLVGRLQQDAPAPHR